MIRFSRKAERINFTSLVPWSVDDASFDPATHDAFIWKQMWVMMGTGLGLIIGLFYLV